MVAKIEHRASTPAGHLDKVTDVALLIDLAWNQLDHLGPGGCLQVRVETAKWSGKG